MKSLVTYLLVFPFFIPSISLGCSCLGDKSNVKKEMRKSDAVFYGTVKSVEIFKVDPENIQKELNVFIGVRLKKVVLEIKETIKGVEKSSLVTVITGLGNGDCGVLFEEGKEYVVYSSFSDTYSGKSEKVPKYLYTSICTRTTINVKQELLLLKG